MTVTELPLHAVEAHDHAPRWIPARAGILNVWRYYDEVFEFHEGRLLLRGQNGSGKSKALELLLPFLFDANLRASRLSTFGTSERTMHWNLMGEGASGTTRVGYVWLEFRFPGDQDRWFVCGARLQASTHTTAVHADYFTTEQRIGSPEGLALVNDAGQPLTRSLLEERLGGAGTLHGNAGDYRAAVRSSLFPQLSEARYDALITALLQLRTPKLSQRLDPALLSSLLSRALPPLGQQEIADLAEGFERLDRQRERLAALDQEVAATRTLAARQRTYARRVLRAAAATLISSTTDLDNLTRTARESAAEHERVDAAKSAATALVKAMDDAIAETEARIEGLTESDEYKEGKQLDRLRQQAAEAKSKAAAITKDAVGKRTTADDDQKFLRDAELTVDRVAHSVMGLETESRHAATRAGMASVHAELAGILSNGDSESARPKPLLRAAVRSRHSQLNEVRAAVGAHDTAIARRKQAEDELDEARTALSDMQQKQEEAAEHRDAVLTRLGVRLTEWIDNCRELSFPDPDALVELAESEMELLELIDTVTAPVLDEITRGETTTEAELRDIRLHRDSLTAQIERLTSTEDLPPDPPPTRTTDRSAMTGAPLWRLVDFEPQTPESMHASIEAALQAAGLLDAWVDPSGTVDGHDVFADPAALMPAPGRSLADVLVPEEGSTEVSVGTVRRLLAAIAYGDDLPSGHPAAIGADGGWRLGNLTGTWSKEQASHIGALARQRGRARRISQLRADIEELDGSTARLTTELNALRLRRAVVAGERANRPDHRELTEATHALVGAVSDVNAADRAVRRQVDIVSAWERQVSQALLTLTELAARHGVPTDRQGLAGLGVAVDSFGDQAENWLDEQDSLTAKRRTAVSLGVQADRSRDSAEQREEEAAEAAERQARLAATLEAVESTVGVDYRHILAELGELRTHLSDLRQERHEAGEEVTRLAEKLGELNAKRVTDATARDEATATRDLAAHRFRHLATGSLPADSELDDFARFEETLSASNGVRASLDGARLVAAMWPTVPHTPTNLGDALHRLSESVHDCRATLSARADLDLETDEDVQIFTAVVDGVSVGAAELLRILHTEAEQSRHEITERERDLFDQTLTGDTRRHLAARIRQANELVDGMNTRLERVRTASKVAVQLVWQVAPDLPSGTKAARDLLLKDPVRLTDADRESLHRFFRDRIEQAKADDTAASWEQQLAQVLDYTAWHRFVVRVDRANGDGWQLLTRKLHGALSGGEKAIVLHLPLFAAVAAHYQAAPEAPRIILLDEVFVGVDSMNRGQVFALLSALDLDLMLTSDHEWCTYTELSGIGIHQLITGDDNDAVTTARFTWDGHELNPDQLPR